MSDVHFKRQVSKFSKITLIKNKQTCIGKDMTVFSQKLSNNVTYCEGQAIDLDSILSHGLRLATRVI